VYTVYGFDNALTLPLQGHYTLWHTCVKRLFWDTLGLFALNIALLPLGAAAPLEAKKQIVVYKGMIGVKDANYVPISLT
jgi:hypothetical protein